MLIMWCLRPNMVPYRTSRRQTMLEKDKTDPPKTTLGSPWASLGLPGPSKPPKVPTVTFIYTQYHPSTCCISCYHSQIGQFFTVIPKSVHQLQLEFFYSMMFTLLARIYQLLFISMLKTTIGCFDPKKNLDECVNALNDRFCK